MPDGSIANKARRDVWLPIALIGAIFVCAGLLLFADPNKFWTIVITVASTIAGAQLGNVLRADLSGDLVRNQARPAVRELFDHSSRLSEIVQRSEAHQVQLEEAVAARTLLDQQRIADWFGSVGFALRGEIASTASAIENWGDMAKDVLDVERMNYVARQKGIESHKSDSGKEVGANE